MAIAAATGGGGGGPAPSISGGGDAADTPNRSGLRGRKWPRQLTAPVAAADEVALEGVAAAINDVGGGGVDVVGRCHSCRRLEGGWRRHHQSRRRRRGPREGHFDGGMMRRDASVFGRREFTYRMNDTHFTLKNRFYSCSLLPFLKCFCLREELVWILLASRKAARRQRVLRGVACAARELFDWIWNWKLEPKLTTHNNHEHDRQPDAPASSFRCGCGPGDSDVLHAHILSDS